MAKFVGICLNKASVAYVQLLPEDAEKVADLQIKFIFYFIGFIVLIKIGFFILDIFDK